MPLTATLDGQRFDALFATDQDWQDLKRTYRSRDLAMGCGQPGVPRKSKLGLRHFVHKAAVGCADPACAPESVQHLTAKSVIARAAAAADWKATVEYPAHNRSWIADVLAEKDGRRIALEVQLSRQDSTEFEHRQQRYAQAGIECFWFVHKRNVQAAEDAKVPFLVFQGDGGEPHEVLARKAFQKPERFSLACMVTAFLGGSLVDSIQATATKLFFEFTTMECLACHKPSTIWRLNGLRLTTRCGGEEGFSRLTHSDGSEERIESSFWREAQESVKGKASAPPAALRDHNRKGGSGPVQVYGCAYCSDGFFGEEHIGKASGWRQSSLPVLPGIAIRGTLLGELHVCNEVGDTCTSQPPSGRVISIDAPDWEEGDPSPTWVRDWVPLFGASSVDPENPWAFAPTLKPAQKAQHLALCDFPDHGNHPASTCVWRKFRAFHAIEEGAGHYIDDLHNKVLRGELSETAGREMLERFLERSKASRAVELGS